MKFAVFRRLRWLPNALTVSRMVLAIGMFIAALQGAWILALWLLLTALATDFLDGLAAKKLNAKSAIGEELDGWADSLLVILGMLSLSITGSFSWLGTIAVIGGGVAIGSDRFFTQPYWRWRAALAVVCLFLAWVWIVWFYATLAYGWSWMYVLFTGIVLMICALFKQHRIATWLHR